MAIINKINVKYVTVKKSTVEKEDFTIKIFTAAYNSVNDKNKVRYVETYGSLSINNDNEQRSLITFTNETPKISCSNNISDFVNFAKWMYVDSLIDTSDLIPVSDFSDVDWQNSASVELDNIPQKTMTIIALFDYTAGNTEGVIPTLVVNVFPTSEDGGIPNNIGGEVYVSGSSLTLLSDHLEDKPSSESRIYSMYYSTANTPTKSLAIYTTPKLGYLLSKATINNTNTTTPSLGQMDIKNISGSTFVITPYFTGTYTFNSYSNLRILYGTSNKQITVKTFVVQKDDYFKINATENYEPSSSTSLSLTPYSSNENNIFTWTGYANTVEHRSVCAYYGSVYSFIGFAIISGGKVENIDIEGVTAITIKTQCVEDTTFIYRLIKPKKYSIQLMGIRSDATNTINPSPYGMIQILNGNEEPSIYRQTYEVTGSEASSPFDFRFKLLPNSGCKVDKIVYYQSSNVLQNKEVTVNSTNEYSITFDHPTGTTSTEKTYHVNAYFSATGSSWNNVTVTAYAISAKTSTDRVSIGSQTVNPGYGSTYEGKIPSTGYSFNFSTSCPSNYKLMGYWLNNNFTDVVTTSSFNFDEMVYSNTTVRFYFESVDVDKPDYHYSVTAFPVLGENTNGLPDNTGGDITNFSIATKNGIMWYASGNSLYAPMANATVTSKAGYEFKGYTTNGGKTYNTGLTSISSGAGDSILRFHFVPVASITPTYSIVVLPVLYDSYKAISPNTTVGTVTMSSPSPNMTGLNTGMYGRNNITEGESTSVTVTASAKSGHNFLGWTLNYEGDDIDSNYVSTATTYSTTVTNTTILRAIFK